MPDAPTAGAEPGIIDQALLESKTQQKPFAIVEKLCLHTLDIWKIDHLWMFEKLSILKLNGNAIEKLENLENLRNLRELNVSHNRISQLEGLNTLTRLHTLLVHHNNIKQLEGLDELQELRLLSIGYNQLATRDDIFYLRRVKSLRALSVEGNPLCSLLSSYEEFTAAVLPELRYLNYKLVKRPQQLSIEIRAVLSRVQEIEAADTEAFQASEKERIRREILNDAFVDDLEVDDLVNIPEPHWAAILEVGGDTAMTMFQEHREQMQHVCTSLQHLGLKQRSLRQTEEQEFAACWKLACEMNRENCMSCVATFLEPKETIYRTLRRLLLEIERRRGLGEETTSEIDTVRNTAQQLTRNAEHLWKSLFELELEVQEQLETLATQFSQRMADQVEILVNEACTFLLDARDLEEQFNARLQEPCTLRLANMKFLRNSTATEVMSSRGKNDQTTLSPHAEKLLADDELLGAWFRETHETRLLKIAEREIRLQKDTTMWLEASKQRIALEAFNRSRARILEIINFIEMQKKEIADLQPTSLAFKGLL